MGDNPFDDEKLQNKVSNSPVPEIDLLKIVQRLAEIEDELARRELNPLLKEKEVLRKVLKDVMVDTKRDVVYDETSNQEAVLIQRFEDKWDIRIFKADLTIGQRARYLITQVLPKAIAEGIKIGELSRATLEKKGAVRKNPRGLPALYVRERKPEEEVSPD